MATRTAARDRRMIALTVKFWTNNIAPGGRIEPRHAWTSGTVRVDANAAHGIRSGRPVPFNSLLSLPAAIERVLVQHQVTLHANQRDRKYLAPDPHLRTTRRRTR
jgi:hypothetical protein